MAVQGGWRMCIIIYDMRFRHSQRAFTLIELLVVIAIIAILAVVVVLVLNPAELLKQSRDANRLQDMATLVGGINLYDTDLSGSASFDLGSSSVVYVSIPDPAATSTLGDQCQGLGLLSLPAGYAYHCAASSTYHDIDGAGWIPVDLKNISSGSPLGSLPVDPVNASSSRLYYTYTTNGSQYELTMAPESQKYQLGGSNDVIAGDGAPLATVYAKGTNLSLEPLDYGDPSLAGYWPLDEGSGTVAYDDSGNNATGSWQGTPSGANGTFYVPGNGQAYAGAFDGTNNYIALPVTENIFSNAKPFTFTAWVDQSVLQYDDGLFGVCTNTALDDCLHIAVRDGYPYFGFYSDDITSGLTATDTLYYLAFVYNGGGSGMRYIYENGTLVASGQSSVTGLQVSGTTLPVLGEDQMGSMNGTIQDARLYNRALSPGAIAALYSGKK